MIPECIIKKSYCRVQNFDSRTLYRQSFKRSATPRARAQVSSTSQSSRKTCFLGRSNSFGQFTGIVGCGSGRAAEEKKEEEMQESSGSNGGRKWREGGRGALERGWKERVRVGRAPSYRLMVCSRIGLVDRRLNWVSVQSPANTSSTDSPVRARG